MKPSLPLVFRTLCVVFLLTICHHAQASNSPAYEQRRTNYIDTALAHFGSAALPIQAYMGLPVDTAALNALLYDVRTGGDADFSIVQAVRVLEFTQGSHAYDSVILASMSHLKFWINYADTFHVYWSENHMIMWMSSEWLLHEGYGRAVDTNLRKRIVHYLDLKNKFGFYEFHSSVYAPYCLSGILNLADFAQDPQIKALAITAAQRLMSEDILRLSNDQGVLFPAAGRNYNGKYDSPYGQNHSNLIWLLTGNGPAPGGASHCGGFLSTSTVPVDSVTASWSPYLDTTYYNGNSLDTSFILNQGQDSLDKVIFHWSGGAYFGPQVAYASGALLYDSALWYNVTFQAFLQLKGLPLSTFPQISQSLSVLSTSSVIMGTTLAEFKHKSVTLSSIHDYFKGKIGFQQFPCVANVGTTAVYTGSGPVHQNWNDRSADNNNYHLPYVEQHKNVALLMYRPLPVPTLLPYQNTDVALRFTTADYDEVDTDNLWLIGRQAHNYVAVRMYCGGEIDSVPACHMTTDGQAYVIIVGDTDMYGSFAHFRSLVHTAQFRDSNYYDAADHQSIYYAHISFDTTSISYAWGRDSITTGINDLVAGSPLHVYPNPASAQVTLALDAAAGDIASLQITDVMGRSVYQYDGTDATHSLSIDTRAWPAGLYFIRGENRNGSFMQKLVKE